jgi:enoyl-CoA hydratase/carnithine racemase
MDSIFNYTTLSCFLQKSTRSLIVNLKSEHLSFEQLFELESLINWATSRVEIASILFSTTHHSSHQGINPEHLKSMSEKQLMKFAQKVQSLSESFLNLPQTIIFDLKNGSNNLSTELSLGADIRIASVNSSICFDHLNLGILPCSGGISLLGKILTPQIARNWILSGDEISAIEMRTHGFIMKTYDSSNHQDVINQLLSKICSQAPVQRIQAKLGLYELIREDLEKTKKFEKQVAKAAFIAEDWKNREHREFMPAKSMSYTVKLSLIKTETEENPQ